MLEFGNLQMPYLDSSDAPDIGGQALAQAQRLELISGAGVAFVADATARAALVTNGDAFNGLLVMQLDTYGLYLRKAGAWKLMELPWTTYVPTIANFSSTSPTITGKYAVAGGIVQALVQAKLGTGTITVAAASATLPVAADTTGMILDSTLLQGAAGFKDVSLGDQYAGSVRIIDANTVRAMRFTTTGSGSAGTLSSTLPFTWATLDEMSLAFSYPAA